MKSCGLGEGRVVSAEMLRFARQEGTQEDTPTTSSPPPSTLCIRHSNESTVSLKISGKKWRVGVNFRPLPYQEKNAKNVRIEFVSLLECIK